MNQRSRKTIALAIGDPNGIGPEIAVKAARQFAGDPRIELVLVGDEHVVRFYAEHVAADMPIGLFGEAEKHARALKLLPVDCLPQAAFTRGQGSAASGKATVDYVNAAVDLVKQGRAAAVVACPHSEAAVNAAGISFAGYPGLVARLMDIPETEVFLMLVGGGLRIVHVTLHERLQNALLRITPDLVCKAAQAAASALRSSGIARPKIGLFGINPHVGEGGLFGDDDERITIPAAATLRAGGLDLEGPLGADLMLMRRDIDAFVAMYHDQGHIPIKLLAGRNSAAMSIGAGFVFSSVGHGSAFDIAGRGIAEPDALIRSIELVSGSAILEAHAGVDA
ncbi:MAG TPA: 4-hydroxythreonine-4-phosphate dehydrogenase PdxA [Beijerinckiaceae bacterium]|nr:4-hydroxythreonine-4-phosphate dehydrogenase PdxA [Beijerinckiaceae bacterium]